MKRLMLIPILLFIQAAFAGGPILITHDTQDHDSYSDSIIVHYQVCDLSTSSPVICTDMQQTPTIRNPEAWPLNISPNEKQVIVYQVDVYNDGYKIFTQYFANSACINGNKGGSITLRANNNTQRVICEF